MCESVEHVLWECSEYTRSSIRKEFISNLDGILQNNIHQKSSFDKTKYIFDQNFYEYNGHFDYRFSNTKVYLCSIICIKKDFIL